jgi:hypothetical protein
MIRGVTPGNFSLNDGFHVGLLHFFADFPMHGEATEAVEKGAEEVEGAGNVEVADVEMPVLVGLERLGEAGPFLGDIGGGAGEQAIGLEDAIDAGRAAGDDVGVEHHEGEPPIAFERVLTGEGADALLFVVGEPMVARHPGVMLVDLAETQLPVVELAGADADPGQEATDGNVRLVAPAADEIDELVADIVSDPAAL